jgi:tetratricopeptide (TPR) repeat protein
LLELGRIYRENHKDNARARTVWQAALTQWHKRRTLENEDDRFLCAQILVNLAALEDQEKNYPKAVEYLRQLLVVSPNQKSIQAWIDQLAPMKTNAPGERDTPSGEKQKSQLAPPPREERSDQ